MELENETFGCRITRLRKNMGLNKAELARLANITRTAIGMYEERETADKCQVQHLRSLSRVLSTSMDYLIDGIERAGMIDEAMLERGVAFAQDLIPGADPKKAAKLIKFVYGLEAQGITPTKEIVRGFYLAL